MEEEEDDLEFWLDDDEELEVATYNHLLEAESSRPVARVDDLVHLMLHQRSFGRGIFPLVTG